MISDAEREAFPTTTSATTKEGDDRMVKIEKCLKFHKLEMFYPMLHALKKRERMFRCDGHDHLANDVMEVIKQAEEVDCGEDN